MVQNIFVVLLSNYDPKMYSLNNLMDSLIITAHRIYVTIIVMNDNGLWQARAVVIRHKNVFAFEFDYLNMTYYRAQNDNLW